MGLVGCVRADWDFDRTSAAGASSKAIENLKDKEGKGATGQ